LAPFHFVNIAEGLWKENYVFSRGKEKENLEGGYHVHTSMGEGEKQKGMALQ